MASKVIYLIDKRTPPLVLLNGREVIVERERWAFILHVPKESNERS